MVYPVDINVNDTIHVRRDHSVVKEFVEYDGIEYAKTTRGILIPLTVIWNSAKGLEV